MCGRYNLVPDAAAWLAAFEIVLDPQIITDLKPNYNVCPSMDVLAIRADQGVRTACLLRWGLLPSWSKEKKIAYNTINARAETVDTAASYRTPFRRRRCLIPASGFYEWRESTPKVPFNIRRKDGAPMAFAGIWDRWEKEGEVIESCSIIVTQGNALMQPIHNRMPVMIDRKDYDFWLNPDMHEPEKLKPLLVPYAGVDLEAYTISTAVNTPKNNNPRLLEPVTAS